MAQVKGGAKSRSSGGKAGSRGGKKPTPGRDAAVKQTADASSVILTICLIAAGLVGIAAWMGRSISVVEDTANDLVDGFVQTVGLSVDTIRIYEATPDQETRILQLIDISKGDNMFRADPHKMRERLMAQRDFGEVQVHRFWPGQISVFVTPLKASVRYWDGESYTVMSHDGRVAAGDEIIPASLPIVTGKGAVRPSADLFRDLEDYPVISAKLRYAERISERRWDLVFLSGARVQLPAGTAREEGIERLAVLHRETGLLDRRVATIDLRDPNRIYTRRSAVTADLQTSDNQG